MLPGEEYPSTGLSGFARAFVETFLGLGIRLLVHFCSLILAAVIGASADFTHAFSAGTASLAFSIYIGLICLVPRGIGKRGDWLIPSGAGLTLIILWSLFGMPWQFCVLWGGALTFTIRLLMKQGMMDWEWSALPFMLIAMYGFFNEILPLSPARPPYFLFFALAGGGWAAVLFYNRMRGDSMQREMLKEACAALEKSLAANALSESLQAPAMRLARQGRRLLALSPRLGKDTAGLSRATARLAGQLKRLGPRLSPVGAARAKDRIDELNDAFQTRIKALEPVQAAAATAPADDASLEKRLAAYRELGMRLLDKAPSLPRRVREDIKNIAVSTDKIITCMREDPNDVASGDRFLSRYLKAAHTVTDEYARLSAQGGSHNEVAQTLARSEELLTRLRNAFAEEHVSLLRNDTLNFTAELNVLDKLLKMEGK
ncbi:MAG: 5-bromo-4-chloroindolyl phosphate hydrolysis family protein [Desulfovibrio sp.]|jgi:hypothetical protein|nr:5-bromo-4-chloroindolyl phosphate hydrolysis family protein [Desulfovibrio sp.]